MSGNGISGISGYNTNFQSNIMGQSTDNFSLDVYDYQNKNRLLGNVHLRTSGNLYVNVHGNLIKNTTSVEGNLVLVNTNKILDIKGTTDSTGIGAGALVVAGGLSVAKKINVGDGTVLDSTNANNTALNVSGGARVSDRLYIGSTQDASSSTAAALVVNGGVAVGRDLWVGGNLMVRGNRIEINVSTMTVEDPLMTLHKSSNADDTNNTLAHIQTTGAGLEFYAYDYAQNGNIVGYAKTSNSGQDFVFKSVNQTINGVVSLQPHATRDSYVLLSNTRDNTVQRIFNSNIQVDQKMALGGVVATVGNTLDVSGDVGFRHNLVVNANIVSSSIVLTKYDLGTVINPIDIINGTLSVNGFAGRLFLSNINIKNTGELINFTIQNNKLTSDRLVFLNLLYYDGTSFAPTVFCSGTNNGSFNVQYSSPFVVTNGNVHLKYVIF